MSDLATRVIEAAKASRWGLTALLGGATVLVGTGMVGYETPEAQAAGGGAGLVVILGVGMLVRRFVTQRV